MENPRERSEKIFRALVDSIGKMGLKEITVARDHAGSGANGGLSCLGETHNLLLLDAAVQSPLKGENFLTLLRAEGLDSLARMVVEGLREPRT